MATAAVKRGEPLETEPLFFNWLLNKQQYEKVFNFLDKNKKKKISADDVILGLGALGKICTLEEKTQIENDSNFYDLESFTNICQEKIDLNNIEMNLRNFLLCKILYKIVIEPHIHHCQLPEQNLNPKF